MIYIEPRHLEIIQKIITQYPYNFFIFGSRIKGTQKKFSDLDLCYKDAIPEKIIYELEESFENSDLPFKVDIVNWNTCSDSFQKLIQAEMVNLNTFFK